MTRVAHVITKLALGGAQATVLELCNGLDRDRYDIHVVCGPEQDREGTLVDEFRESGVALHVIPSMARTVSALSDLGAIKSVRRLFATLRPDVVHTHTSKAGAIGRIAAPAAHPVATVHTVHGWSFDHAAGRFAAPMIGTERLLARRCDRLVVVTPEDATVGLRNGIGRREQYVCIRSGIEPARFAFSSSARVSLRDELGVAFDDEVVGTVGRLSEQKDPLALVQAFALVLAARPRAHLVIVGDGPMHDQVVRRVREAGLGDRVHLVGARHDAAAWYSAMDVFALASRWEGLPRAALEAFASGLPVAATNTSGMVELGPRGAVLSSIGDHRALACSLVTLLDRRRSLRVVPTWIHDFSVERMVSDTAALYDELVPAPTYV